MLGHSIVSQHFMELEGSIPSSQELSTCSYPEMGPCPRSMARPRVADGGTASSYGG
jgi:hypothetical protein